MVILRKQNLPPIRPPLEIQTPETNALLLSITDNGQLSDLNIYLEYLVCLKLLMLHRGFSMRILIGAVGIVSIVIVGAGSYIKTNAMGDGRWRATLNFLIPHGCQLSDVRCQAESALLKDLESLFFVHTTTTSCFYLYRDR